MMAENNPASGRKYSYIGAGIAMGIGAGLISMIFFDNDLGAGIGMTLAIALGIGLVADELEKPPLSTLIGTAIGIIAGLSFSLLIIDDGFNSTIVLITAFGALIGMIAGAFVDIRIVRRDKKIPAPCVDDGDHNP
jgi:hypothetical protein